MFSSCSHGVPQVVPNSTTILSHMVCPKFNSYVYKLKRWARGENICFCFGIGGPTRCCYGGVPQCSKRIGDGAINVVSFKKKKSVGRPWTKLIWIRLIMSHNGLFPLPLTTLSFILFSLWITLSFLI
jgi:hypothetical protein